MPSRHLPDPPALPLVVSRTAALEAGLTRDQIRQRVRADEWSVLAPGVYVRAPLKNFSPSEQHALRAEAAVLRHPEAVVIGASATAAHRLPLVHALPSTIETGVPDEAWRGVRNGVRLRSLLLLPEDLDPSRPWLTSPARTWLDVARERPFEDALALGDALLHRGLTTAEELAEVIARAYPLRGLSRARTVLPHLDGRRDSPFESWSWSFFLEWGIPLPEMQVVIYDDWGQPRARLDFFWRELGVVGEADGLMKYRPENGGLEAIAAEKDREAWLRDQELDMVRWRWWDLANRPLDVLRRLERAFERARKRAA